MKVHDHPTQYSTEHTHASILLRHSFTSVIMFYVYVACAFELITGQVPDLIRIWRNFREWLFVSLFEL